MLFTKNHTTDELITRELSTNPGLDINQLIAKIAPHIKKKITVQGWYKAIRRLANQGVIIKHHKQYSLNISWITEMLQWLHQMKTVYIEKEEEKIPTLPQKANSKIRHRFPDLLSMNTFWAHTLVHIASKNQGNNDLYAYNPHFWFYLAHDPIENQYNRSMEECGAHTYMIIGSNNFLDQWNAQFFPKTVTFWLSPKPLYPDFAIHINYISGYLIEVKLQKTIADQIHKLFTSTQTINEISQLELISLFQQKSPCVMTISKNRTKGEAFKRKIMRHF